MKIKRKNLLFILPLMLLLFSSSAAAEDTSPLSSFSINRAPFHYSLGIQAYLNGRLDEAIDELEKALTLDPQSTFLTIELASLLSEKGDLNKAIDLCEKAAKRDDDWELHLLLGGLYLNKGNRIGALREYEKVISLNDKNTQALLYAAILYSEDKDPNHALILLDKLLTLEPNHLLGNFYAGKILSKKGKYLEAEEKLKKVLTLKPFFEEAVLELAHVFEKLNKWEEALNTYRNFLQINPHSLNTRLKLVNLLHTLKREEEANKELNEIIEKGKKDRQALYTLGLFYLEKQNYREAIRIFKELLKKTPNDHRLRYLLGSAYEGSKDIQSAITLFKEIPPDSDFFINARISISISLKNLGQIEAAIRNMEEALTIKKDVPDFYLLLSTLYEENQNLSKAEEVLKRGISATPSVQLHYGLGVLYEKTGRFEESIEQMRTVLELDSENAEAMNFIGYSYIKGALLFY